MSLKVSVYLCRILRHDALKLGLPINLDGGWLDVDELIRHVNNNSKFRLDREALEEIVRQDNKGRYRFNDSHTQIRCCQGHTIPGLKPCVTKAEPPQFLYHGTTTDAVSEIERSGAVEKMGRHAVHLYSMPEKAWVSAERRRRFKPAVIKINAADMYSEGFEFYVSDNDVWLTERVPVRFFADILYFKINEQ